MCGPKSLGLCAWIERDLVFVFGPKMACFQCGFRLTSFFGVVEINGFLYRGRTLLSLVVITEIDFIFVWVVEIDLISVWWFELDLTTV